MSNLHGNFIWYDLMTSDSTAAEDFYRGVVGWRAQDSGMPNGAYTLLSAGDTQVGGLMPLPPEACAAGAKPTWTGYIAVDDVDAYAGKVKQAGGAIHQPPMDIPGIGRFARVADLHGAAFMLFKGNGEAPKPVTPGTPGHIGWRELYAGNGEAAFAFYSSLFGWTKAEAMDMGPMGVYQIFAIGGVPSGGMMTKTAETPAPTWQYYFNVDGIDAATKRVKDKGGDITLAATEVPGGMWIVQGRDPQGAAFALVGPKG